MISLVVILITLGTLNTFNHLTTHEKLDEIIKLLEAQKGKDTDNSLGISGSH